MKKITSPIFLFGILASTNMLSAQIMTQEKMKAIHTDDVAIFKKHFAPGDYNKCFAVGSASYSPLGFSASAGKNNIIKFLLDNKAQINKKCQNMTPFEIAESGKNQKTKDLLLSRGGNRD